VKEAVLCIELGVLKRLEGQGMKKVPLRRESWDCLFMTMLVDEGKRGPRNEGVNTFGNETKRFLIPVKQMRYTTK
jgi:hypothetical protein